MSDIVIKSPVPAAQAMLKRKAAFKLFNEWEHRFLSPIRTPAEVIADLGALYEFLPITSRQRSVDASGVKKFHNMFTKQCLSE